MVNQEEVKRVSVKYCKDVLTKNDPKEEVKRMVELGEELHQKRMKTSLGMAS